MLFQNIEQKILLMCILCLDLSKGFTVFHPNLCDRLKRSATYKYYDSKGDEKTFIKVSKDSKTGEKTIIKDNLNGEYYARFDIPRSIFNLDAAISTDCIRWISYIQEPDLIKTTETGVDLEATNNKRQLAVDWLYLTNKLYPFYKYAAGTSSAYIQHYYSTPYFREKLDPDAAGKVYKQPIYITDAIMKKPGEKGFMLNRDANALPANNQSAPTEGEKKGFLRSVLDSAINYVNGTRDIKDAEAKIEYDPSEHKVVIAANLLGGDLGYEGIQYLGLFISDNATIADVSRSMNLVVIPSIRRIHKEWSWFGDGSFPGAVQIATNKYSEAVYVNWPLMQFFASISQDISQTIEDLFDKKYKVKASESDRNDMAQVMRDENLAEKYKTLNEAKRYNLILDLRIEKLRAIQSSIDAALAVEAFTYYQSYGQIPITLIKLGLAAYFLNAESTINTAALALVTKGIGTNQQLAQLTDLGGKSWGTVSGLLSDLSKGYIFDKVVNGVIKKVSGDSSSANSDSSSSQTQRPPVPNG